MGCGKSSLGCRLSYQHQLPFIDTDKYIEQQQKQTVAEIFAQAGEPYFRQLETEALEQLCCHKVKTIIAVGGGLPMRAENRRLLHKLGCVIYLRASAEILYDRLQHDTTRPLLQGTNPKQTIIDLLAQRAAIYEKTADIVIEVDGYNGEQIATQIWEAIEQYEPISD